MQRDIKYATFQLNFTTAFHFHNTDVERFELMELNLSPQGPVSRV